METKECIQSESKIWQCYLNMKLSEPRDNLQEAQAWLDKREDAKGGVVTLESPTGKKLLKVLSLDKAGVEKLMKKSTKALETWKNANSASRCQIYQRLMQCIKGKFNALIQLESMENGRKLNELDEFDVPAAEKSLSYNLGFSPSYTEGTVVVALLPDALSFLSAIWILCDAVASGSCVIFKPSPHCSLVCLYLQELCSNIEGLPEGLVQTATGGDDVGVLLATHPSAHKVVYRGRESSAKAISAVMASAPYNELYIGASGKSSMLIFDSADLDSSVEGIIEAAAFCGGKAPWSAHKVLVQQTCFNEVVSRLRDRVPNATSSDLPEDLKNVLEEQKSVVRGDGRVWVVENVSPCSSVVLHPPELPLVVVIPFRTAKEAINIAGNAVATKYASVWSQDVCQAIEVSKNLKAHCVWINCHGITDKRGRCGGSFELFKFQDSKEDPSPRDSETLVKSDANFQASKLYIAGALRASSSGQCYTPQGSTINVSTCSKADVAAAVDAAVKAQPSWSSLPPHRRAQIICQIATIGRTIDVKDVTLPFEDLYVYGRISARGRNVAESPDVMSLSSPRGVIGIIGCDSDSVLPLLGAALAAGNTVVVAASEHKPLPLLELMKVLLETSLPSGVVNILTGSSSLLTQELSSSSGISSLWCLDACEATATTVKKNAASKSWLTRSSPDLQYCHQELLNRATVEKTIWLPACYSFAN